MEHHAVAVSHGHIAEALVPPPPKLYVGPLRALARFLRGKRLQLRRAEGRLEIAPRATHLADPQQPLTPLLQQQQQQLHIHAGTRKPTMARVSVAVPRRVARTEARRPRARVAAPRDQLVTARVVAVPSQSASKADEQLLDVSSTSQHACAQLRPGRLRWLRRFLRSVGSAVRPKGPGGNDTTVSERALNVATCGMFFQAGHKVLRLCRSAAARRFGWTFMCVGAIATLYHSSWGRFKSWARKVDYYSIALSSMVLRAAVCGPWPAAVRAGMLAGICFAPTLVTTTNFMCVEVRYLLLALSNPCLLAGWATHVGLSLGATASFALEDTPLVSWCQYSHAAFHVLSAAAFLTLPGALNLLAESKLAAS